MAVLLALVFLLRSESEMALVSHLGADPVL